MGFNVTQITLPTPAGAYMWPPAYASGLFVSVCGSINTNSTDALITSPDGDVWTQRALPFYGKLSAPAVGAGAIVSVNSIGLTTTAGVRSTDGITWAPITLPVAAGWTNVAFGNGVFVALKTASTTAATSADGVSWTQRTLPVTFSCYSLVFFNGLFLAFSTSTYLTSPDGVTWTQRTLDAGVSQYIRSAVVGPDVILVAPRLTSTCFRSTDGITWEQLSLPVSSNWAGGVYGDGAFMLLSYSTPSAVVVSENSGGVWEDISQAFSVAYLTGAGYSQELQIFTALSGTTPEGLFFQKMVPFWANSRGQREVL